MTGPREGGRRAGGMGPARLAIWGAAHSHAWLSPRRRFPVRAGKGEHYMARLDPAATETPRFTGERFLPGMAPRDMAACAADGAQHPAAAPPPFRGALCLQCRLRRRVDPEARTASASAIRVSSGFLVPAGLLRRHGSPQGVREAPERNCVTQPLASDLPCEEGAAGIRLMQ